jgi:RND family efflux transporter MFP subunit
LKKALIIIACVVVGGLIFRVVQTTLRSGQAEGSRLKGPAVAVEVSPVRKTTIQDIGRFSGSLIPKSQFVVAPKISGRLEKLLVNIGDRVKAGQLIAVLDDEEYKQQAEQSKAELDVAKASLEESVSNLQVAGREFERAQALREKKIASESELDSASALYSAEAAKNKLAQAQVAQKEAALKAAQVRLSYTEIRVSWEGVDESQVVGERFVDEGAMLAANSPIVSVLDDSALTAVISVIERDYPKVRPGQEASAETDAFAGRSFSGKIARIAPLLKEASREARVEIEVPNDEGLLKPGMFVRVQIEFSRHEDATVVPQVALIRRNGAQGVFLADTEGMKARFVPITVGIIEGELAEVLKPPLTGSVVTLGHHLLEDGSSIVLPSRDLDTSSGQARAKQGSAQKSSGAAHGAGQ